MHEMQEAFSGRQFSLTVEFSLKLCEKPFFSYGTRTLQHLLDQLVTHPDVLPLQEADGNQQIMLKTRD